MLESIFADVIATKFRHTTIFKQAGCRSQDTCCLSRNYQIGVTDRTCNSANRMSYICATAIHTYVYSRCLHTSLCLVSQPSNQLISYKKIRRTGITCDSATHMSYIFCMD
jgi:hypothetical protein